ncbi:hypothetical protein QWY28_16965 [Nocardioides sp. SOB77]|uniref:Diadenosine tetraphosphate (Ap4A) HIT family hydrolase n=1 Tax=Nocardioides oceani TaxID=3058369 RepID=A0ABT8FJE8_9ACTN|nr:hypothetical protein [Nocardioides oceani]MDN4174655.1 hypothetical protein [Nocardioides oceani]
MDQQPADSPYHRTLPIGERLDASPLLEGPLTSFEDVRLLPLAPMLVPEEPRRGVEDRSACPHCTLGRHTIWADDTWHVTAGWTRMGLPYVGGLAPNEHCRLDDAPPHVLATLGPLLQRLSRAVKQVPGVARVHFSRWGDGSEHFHLWALARPAGMMQGRGAMLAFWDDVLPAMTPEMQEEHLRIVAEALAADGGAAYPARD